MALVFAIQGFGQDVQIGSGTTGQNYFPINTTSAYTYTQQIIKSTEIASSGVVTTGGTITKIRYYWNGTGNFINSQRWKVYLGHTTKSSFTSTTDWIMDTNMTVVFDTNINIPTTPSWFTIYLQTPFIYNGTDNLVIAIDENTPGVASAVASIYGYLSTSQGLRVINSANINPSSPLTGSIANTVSQVKIYFQTPCDIPENLSLVGINSTDATFAWVGGSETQWNVNYKLSSDTVWTSINSITANPYTLTGLSPNTQYDIRINANCGTNGSSNWTPTKSFSTIPIPTQLPYSTSFENSTDNSKWVLINGTQVNKWFIGSGKDLTTGLNVDTLGVSNSLYVSSNANGDTNMYLGGSTANATKIYAARDFFIPAGAKELNLEFDWRANGNASASDFLRAYLVKATDDISAGVVPPSSIDLGGMIGNFPSGTYHWLSKSIYWQHAKFRITESQFPNLGNSNWRLLLHWRNDNTSGTAQPPAAVDNLVMNVVSCPAPDTVNLSNITTSSVDLSWIEKGTATSWNVYYKIGTSSSWSMTIATTIPFTLSGLVSSTPYQVKIQSNCSSDTSYSSLVSSFNTACGNISSFPWFEGFESGAWPAAVTPGNAAAPNCWLNFNKVYTSSLWRRNTNATYLRTGSGSAQMYAGTTTANQHGDYLLTPIISLTGNQMLRFWAKAYSTYNDTLSIMVFNTNAYGRDVLATDVDTSFSVAMQKTFIPSNAFNEYEVDLSQYIGDCRIAFVQSSKGGYYLNIDDVTVMDIPTCKRVTSVGDSNYTVNSADIYWTNGSSSDYAWYLYYKASTATNYDSVAVSSNPYTLTNLTSNTLYQYYIKTNCFSELSEPCQVRSLRTACGIINTLPFTETFDTYGTGSFSSWNPCWSRKTDYSPTSYPMISTSYKVSAPGSVYQYVGSANKRSVICAPMIDTNIYPINTLRVKFKLYMTSLSYRGIEVGIMTNPNDTTTFIPVSSPLVPSLVSSWENQEVAFSSYTGYGAYIAFRCMTTSSPTTNASYMDDVEISLIPGCTKPTNLSISNITATSAELTWTNGNPTDNAWWLYYKPSANANFDSVIITSNPYTLQLLNHSTIYQVKMKTLCSNDVSEASSTLSFQTSCVSTNTFPWTEGFESIITNNQLPACWSSTRLSTYTYTQISDYTNYNRKAHSGTKSAYFRYGCNDSFFTSAFDLFAGTTYTFSFWYITDGLNGWNSLSAGVYSNQYDSNLIQNVGNSILNAKNTTYQQFFGSYTPSVSGTYYFGINAQANTTPYYLTIDDLKLEIMSCSIPDSVSLSSILPTSVTMNWNAGTSTLWQVEYKPSDSTTWIKTTSATNLFTFTGLTPSTSYNFRVATLCNGSVDTSMFANLSVKTPCSMISTLPYTENFDTYGTGTGKFPTCWSKFSQYSATYPYINTTNFSSPGSMYFYAYNNQQTYAAFGPIDTSISMDTLRVRFKMYYTALNYHNLQVGIMNNPNDITTFVPVDNLQSITAISTWQDKEVSLASYTGTGRYIAFMTAAPASAYNYGYMDNVVVDYIPACAKPTNLSISNITTTTADLSWTNGNANNTAWWLYTKLASATTFDSVLITSASPYTIINLLPSSEYDYYMKTNCPTEVSEPTPVFSFYTACAPISTFPWYEGFEATWLPMTGVSNAAQPTNCWININGGASTSYNWRKTSSTGIAYIRTGSGSAQLYGANQSMGDYLITPTFTLTGNQRITFWAKGYSTSTNYPENIWVKAFDETTNGALDSFSDTTLFTNIAFINDTNQYTWNEYEFPLTGLVGNYRLVFARNNNVGYYYHIDDLKVDNQPACPRPITASTSNIQQTQAQISWTPGTVTDNAWKIYYRQLGATSWDSVYTTTNPHTLYGLTSTTEYEFSVHTDCGTGAFSDGRTGTFRTSCGFISSLPWADNFDTYGTGTGVMPTCWVRNTSYALRPYVNTGGFSGNCLYFYAGTAGTYAMAITPEFDQSISMNSLILNFKFKSYSATNDTLRIGIMTDTTAASFVEVGKVFGPTTWNDYQVSLASYTGTGKYIGFRVNYGASNTYSYVDNLVVTTGCTSPTPQTTSGITQTDATINWLAGGSESSWEVKLGSAGAVTTVNSTTYTFSSLTAATQYTAYIRANCGTAYSGWVPVNFITDSIPLTAIVTTAPVTTFTYNTASLVGTYTPGADTINAVGFEYKTTAATA
ncbi:MAG: hypothetical protein H6Q15_1391, partial [Bacteroidetes bacterium]|nr:hypothetical protein [Bacteroidota bacterium]